ncbi:hypothetical protein QCA50_013890 [Cerrena zonata]|uniref:Uncharacterized protein n=1 Tax=Cerrena zonata TaxID=2478898 RepID=A0AAW0G0Y5_9APHY
MFTIQWSHTLIIFISSGLSSNHSFPNHPQIIICCISHLIKHIHITLIRSLFIFLYLYVKFPFSLPHVDTPNLVDIARASQFSLHPHKHKHLQCCTDSHSFFGCRYPTRYMYISLLREKPLYSKFAYWHSGGVMLRKKK